MKKPEEIAHEIMVRMDEWLFKYRSDGQLTEGGLEGQEFLENMLTVAIQDERNKSAEALLGALSTIDGLRDRIRALQD